MAQHEIVFAGFGGQGIMFAGQLLSYAAMDQGFHVTWIPSYGPEMRGGTANCYVIISESPIGSPVGKRPGLGLVFNAPSFDKFEPMIAPGGTLVCNVSLVARRSQRADIAQVLVPATDIASELGDLQLTNVILLGAALAVRPILSLDAVRSALENHLPAHRRAKLSANFAALERGAALATAPMR